MLATDFKRIQSIDDMITSLHEELKNLYEERHSIVGYTENTASREVLPEKEIDLSEVNLSLPAKKLSLKI